MVVVYLFNTVHYLEIRKARKCRLSPRVAFLIKAMLHQVMGLKLNRVIARQEVKLLIYRTLYKAKK
jgi:hypothetical protein